MRLRLTEMSDGFLVIIKGSLFACFRVFGCIWLVMYFHGKVSKFSFFYVIVKVLSMWNGICKSEYRKTNCGMKCGMKCGLPPAET